MRVGATLLVLLALLGLPAAASADVSLPAGSAFGDIAAGGGEFAYTARSAGELQLRLGSTADPVPVRGARDFRGLDLGTDAGGRRVLVYSRCDRRCDLFAYTLATRRERKLASLSRPACNERNPRMVRGSVAFVRQRRQSKRTRLRCAGGVYVKRPGQKLQRVSRTPASALDYDGRLLAYNRERSGPGGQGEVRRTEIRVLRPGGRARVLARASSEVDRGGTAGTLLGDVALSGGRVYWTRSVDDEGAGTDVEDVVRAPANGRGATQVLDRDGRLWVHSDPSGQDQFVSSIAVAGSRLFYCYGSGAGLIGRVTGTPEFN